MTLNDGPPSPAAGTATVALQASAQVVPALQREMGSSEARGFTQLARPWLRGAPPSPQLLVLSPHSPAAVVGRERRVQLSRVRGAGTAPVWP